MHNEIDEPYDTWEKKTQEKQEDTFITALKTKKFGMYLQIYQCAGAAFIFQLTFSMKNLTDSAVSSVSQKRSFRWQTAFAATAWSMISVSKQA